MASTPEREPTLSDIAQTMGDVLDRLDTLTSDVEQVRDEIESSNARVEKWDGRLWGLTLGLIGTAWTAIFAASAVVITRTLSGQ